MGGLQGDTCGPKRPFLLVSGVPAGWGGGGAAKAAWGPSAASCRERGASGRPRGPKGSSCSGSRPGASPGDPRRRRSPRPGRRGRGCGETGGKPRCPVFSVKLERGALGRKFAAPAPQAPEAPRDARSAPRSSEAAGGRAAPSERNFGDGEPQYHVRSLVSAGNAPQSDPRGEPAAGSPASAALALNSRGPFPRASEAPPWPPLVHDGDSEAPTDSLPRVPGGGRTRDAHGRLRGSVTAAAPSARPPRLRFLRGSPLPPRPPRCRIPGSPGPRGLPVPRRREVGVHFVGGRGARKDRLGTAPSPPVPKTRLELGTSCRRDEATGLQPPQTPRPSKPRRGPSPQVRSQTLPASGFGPSAAGTPPPRGPFLGTQTPYGNFEKNFT